ncbi:hypothetical protein VTN31DRAFT_6473 [Thermomyces dupontii]|uniref:uncharacterized protein n=1 Tax=Talaromyces thermophilus TaxID=28565 RepID=UPI00374229FB
MESLKPGKRGRKPVFKFTRQNGKLVRKSKGGVDWWRDRNEVLLPKLIPFAKECQKDRPGTVVQEDNAPAHVHFSQQEIYNYYEVQRILWPGNSPDLNMIEPAWNWLKRRTTSRGAPVTREEAIRAWKRAWNDLPQTTIQGWIERMVRHIQKVIELEGGNEYREERTDHDERKFKGKYRKGKLSVRVFYDDDRRGVGAQTGEGEGTELEIEQLDDGFEDVEDDAERME